VLGGETDRTCARAGGVASLNKEVLDDAVEEGVVVVALEAELHEVARRLGGLLGPELDVERPCRRMYHHLPLRRRLEHVDRRHPAGVLVATERRRLDAVPRPRAWSPGSGRLTFSG
jgi:hypothetical protein